MKREEDYLTTDFQGWPVYRMSLSEILMELGATRGTCNEYIIVDEEDKFSSIYPRTLEDDGMGYGVNEKYVTEVNLQNDFCNLFIETKENA